jgi:hypothetical protein
MESGHPFFTKKLDKQRARQRRWLAAIPDSEIHVGARELLTLRDVQPDALGLRETTLREKADEEAKRLPDGLLQQFEAVSRDNERRAFFLENRSEFGKLNDWFDEEMGVEHRITEREKAKGEGKTLGRLIALLVWADRLAIDSHSDSRFNQA